MCMCVCVCVSWLVCFCGERVFRVIEWKQFLKTRLVLFVKMQRESSTDIKIHWLMKWLASLRRYSTAVYGYEH